MKNILPAAAFVLMTGLLISCSGNKKMEGALPAATSRPIDSDQQERTHQKQLRGKWNVVSIHLPEKTDPEAMPDVFITFADSSFGGKAPCNHIGGNYTMTGDSIRFKEIISTKMACERSGQENGFLNLLGNVVSSYTITDSLLLLKDNSDHVIMEFRKASE